MKINFVPAAVALTLLLMYCGSEPQALRPTFYHWQTNLNLTPKQRHLIAPHDRLYVKAFDVIWEGGAAVPTAELKIEKPDDLPQLIPVVFISNEVIRNTPADKIEQLAADIVALLDRTLPNDYPEIQLDCDWTARTRVPYFDLIRAVRRARPDCAISCTIRLHQYRDRDVQGIPPVDRGALMAYNTGDVADWATENSIVDSAALLNYLAGPPRYPLPLDIAVATYDWAVVFRRGKLVHLINEPDRAALADTLLFTPLSGTRARAQKQTYLNGIALYEDDLLRLEEAVPGRIGPEGELIRTYVGAWPGQRLLIYRLGSRLLTGGN